MTSRYRGKILNDIFYVYSVLNETDELVAFPFSEMSFFMQVRIYAKRNQCICEKGWHHDIIVPGLDLSISLNQGLFLRVSHEPSKHLSIKCIVLAQNTSY